MSFKHEISWESFADMCILYRYVLWLGNDMKDTPRSIKYSARAGLLSKDTMIKKCLYLVLIAPYHINECECYYAHCRLVYSECVINYRFT